MPLWDGDGNGAFHVHTGVRARSHCPTVVMGVARGCVKDICGCVKDICGCGKDICGCVKDICGCVKDICGCVKDICGCWLGGKTDLAPVSSVGGGPTNPSQCTGGLRWWP